MGCENLVTVSAFNREIAALKAEIAALKKQQNNPSNLIQKIKDGLLADGNWKKALVGGLLIGGIRLDQAIPQISRLSNVPSELATVKANINGQISRLDTLLSNTNSSLATIAKKADKIDDLADGITDISKRVNEAKGAINATARRIDNSTAIANQALNTAKGASTTAANAATTAGAASSTATGAMGIASKLLGALGAIGGAAGLLALYGYFKAVKPTLAAHDSRLDSLDKGLSNVYSSIGQVDSRARNAQATAAEANSRSVTALNAANKAQLTANNAANIATGADGKASAAQVAANKAQITANAAQGAANSAIAQSNTAINTANQANTTAQDASRKADKAIDIATATQKDLDQYKRDQSKMDQAQVERLSSEHKQIQRLILDLPSRFKEPDRIPYELLAIPALIRGQNSTLNQISRNTSPENLRQRAAEGTCQTMQPGGCGDAAISRHTNPLKGLLNKILQRLDAFNVALSARVSAQLSGVSRSVAGVASKLDTLQNQMLDKFNKLWEYTKMDRVLNVITTAAVIHNSAMLSRNLLVSLVDTVGETLALIGLKDPDGNAYNIGEIISNGAESLIVSIVGQEYFEELSDKWHKSNRIISAAAGVVMALRSVQWAIAEGIETIGTWIARIGNGLEDEGVVSDRKWPWMNERQVNIGKFAGLEKFNNGLETAEEITENIYMTVAAGEEIKESVTLARESTNTFNEVLAEEDATETEAQTQRETDSDSPEPTPEDLAEHEPEPEA